MVMRSDPFQALWNFQKQLEARMASDWLGNSTANMGRLIVAIVELPGVSKAGLSIEAKEGMLRISGKKTLDDKENVSIHRGERLADTFERTITFPIRIDPDRINAVYRDGILVIPRPRPTSLRRSRSNEKVMAVITTSP